MQHFVTHTIGSHGYLAVFVLMAVSSACVPIPSEVVMVFGGALATAAFASAQHLQPLDFVAVSLVGVAGNLVGSWLAYWAGYAGGRPFIHRWGRYLLIRPHEVDRAHDWFERHGELAVFLGRLLPVVRTFISLPAGVVRMGFWRFTTYTVLGCFPWCLLLAWLGYLLGRRWETVERILRPFSWGIAVVILVGGVGFVWRRIRTIRREEQELVARAAEAETIAEQARESSEEPA